MLIEEQYIQENIIRVVTLCECGLSDSRGEIGSSRIIDVTHSTTYFH